MTGVPQRFMDSLLLQESQQLFNVCVYLPPHSVPLKVLQLMQEPDKLKGFYFKCGGFMVIFQVQPLF